MKKKYFPQTALIVVFGLLLILTLFNILSTDDYQIGDESTISLSYLIWSSNDLNGVGTILGVRDEYIVKHPRNFPVYAVDSFDENEYSGLKYPCQNGKIIYYTTVNLKTGEECIAAKTTNDPQWSSFEKSQTELVQKYYGRNNKWDVILSKQGSIKYKKVVGDNIYYTLESRATGKASNVCEIRKFNISTKEDTLVVGDVLESSSFDINQNELLLFVNNQSQIILMMRSGAHIVANSGFAGCWIDDTKVLIAVPKALEKVDINSGEKERLVKIDEGETTRQIILSPNKQYATLYSSYENEKGAGIWYDRIQVVNLNNLAVRDINVIPDVLYGIGWLEGYYPIS